MGIKSLMQLINEKAPGAVRETQMKNLFGRKVAMDASMSLYSFMIAVRPDSEFTLTDESGETTSHLNGMFYRTIRMLRNGLKPVWVFDGKPPTLKGGELAKRQKKKKEAQEALDDAKETGDKVEVAKAVKRTVRVTPTHNEEAKRLLRLMGCAVVEAPCEAEAQCAELAKKGKVWGVGTEDMDLLTFGGPVLLRYLTLSEARKKPVLEVTLSKVLEEMNLTMPQFIDLCILMGCDYADTIKGIGKKRAFDLITEYGSFEKIIDNIDKKKYPVPEGFNLEGVRDLFTNPEVTPAEQIELRWTQPDEEGLVKFLCHEKNFNEERIRGACAKIRASHKTTTQVRMTDFFGAPTIKSSTKRKGKGKGKGKGKKKTKRFTGK